MRALKSQRPCPGQIFYGKFVCAPFIERCSRSRFLISRDCYLINYPFLLSAVAVTIVSL